MTPKLPSPAHYLFDAAYRFLIDKGVEVIELHFDTRADYQRGVFPEGTETSHVLNIHPRHVKFSDISHEGLTFKTKDKGIQHFVPWHQIYGIMPEGAMDIFAINDPWKLNSESPRRPKLKIVEEGKK